MQGQNPRPCKFRYCGEYYDSETGLIYLRNRYYDSTLGRFISEDPARDGTNWYVYCENNPVGFVDPLGLFAKNSALRKGTYNNADVVKLQRRLNELCHVGRDGKPLTVDGNFGANTDYAVREYQRVNGLQVDGSVGPITWKSLGFAFDNDYETGRKKGTPEIYAKSNFVELQTVKIEKGISLGGLYTGMSEIGGDYRYGSWSLEAVTADARGIM